MPGAGEGRAFSAAAAAAAVAKEERKWGTGEGMRKKEESDASEAREASEAGETFVKGFAGSEQEAIIDEATRRQGKVCGDVDKVR